jgi:DNA-binding NarL/FixJ family response regulator
MQAERYGTRAPTKRQQQLIALVAEGFKNREVAEIMGITEYVVKNYLRAVFDKLGLGNRVELALWYEARRNEFVNSTVRKSNSLPSPELGAHPHN